MSATFPAPGQLREPHSWFERGYQGFLTAALFSLGFFLLFSTAGISFALAALLVLMMLSPSRVLDLQPWREPVIAVGLVLFAYVALRTFADGGWTRVGRASVNHYHELVMVPLVWAMLRIARKPNALMVGLMAGCLLVALLHWLVPLVPALHWPLHTRRISLGFGLALCAFLFFENARLGRLPRVFGFAAAAFVAATMVFAYDGRTGHLELLFLTLCAAFRASPRRFRLAIVLATLVASIGVAALSEPVRARVAESVQELQMITGNPDALPGSRVELLYVAKEVIDRGGPIGVGWHHYGPIFAQIAARRLHTTVREFTSENPHNEYLLQLGAGGPPALLLFIAWLASPFWRLLRNGQRADPWVGVLACTAFAFAMTAAFNSALQDFIEGHVYGVLLAWLLVHRVDS